MSVSLPSFTVLIFLEVFYIRDVSAGQLSRLRAGAYISTHTVDILCEILDCNVQDIMCYEKSDANK
ncbi:MAG TPA: helix-turn-helix transcriptional regulator [Candidatus Mediterraneibacter merdavium]|nr:helix-turn-helix transcriptional regulator [Candidatus Mediterraneibacter merdavium]